MRESVGDGGLEKATATPLFLGKQGTRKHPGIAVFSAWLLYAPVQVKAWEARQDVPSLGSALSRVQITGSTHPSLECLAPVSNSAAPS